MAGFKFHRKTSSLPSEDLRGEEDKSPQAMASSPPSRDFLCPSGSFTHVLVPFHPFRPFHRLRLRRRRRLRGRRVIHFARLGSETAVVVVGGRGVPRGLAEADARRAGNFSPRRRREGGGGKGRGSKTSSGVFCALE